MSIGLHIGQEGVIEKFLYGDVYVCFCFFSGARLGFPDVLVIYAVPLVSAVGSSADLERQFSTLGFTYGSLRAQLGAEKARQLAFLYRELNK